MRRQVAELHVAGAMATEPAIAALEEGRFFFDKRETDIFGERLRQGLAMQLVQHGLGVPEIDLAGSAFEKDENASFGARGKMRWPWSQWVGACAGRKRRAILGQQLAQRGQAEPITGGGEEMPPRLCPGERVGGFNFGRIHLLLLHCARQTTRG